MTNSHSITTIPTAELEALYAELEALRAQVQYLKVNERFGMLTQRGLVLELQSITEPVDVVFADGDNFKAWNAAGVALGISDEVNDPYAFTDRLVNVVFNGLRRDSDRCIGQRNSGDEWVIATPVGEGYKTAQYLLERFRSLPLTDAELEAISAQTNGAITRFSATIAVATGEPEQAIVEAAGHVARAKALGLRDCIVTERNLL